MPLHEVVRKVQKHVPQKIASLSEHDGCRFSMALFLEELSQRGPRVNSGARNT